MESIEAYNRRIEEYNDGVDSENDPLDECAKQLKRIADILDKRLGAR